MKKGFVVGVAIIAAAILILVFLLPSKDICTDEVRGYEQKANSSLDLTRSSLTKIKASLSNESSVTVPAQLSGLTATNFAALKACDTQCKLLAQCLRFSFFRPPSVVCPTEYKDYKERIDSASGLISKLQGVATSSKEAEQKAEDLSSRKRDAAELENSSGSTGGRLEQLNDQIRRTQSELLKGLSTLDQQIDQVLRDQQGA